MQDRAAYACQVVRQSTSRDNQIRDSQTHQLGRQIQRGKGSHKSAVQNECLQHSSRNNGPERSEGWHRARGKGPSLRKLQCTRATARRHTLFLLAVRDCRGANKIEQAGPGWHYKGQEAQGYAPSTLTDECPSSIVVRVEAPGRGW